MHDTPQLRAYLLYHVANRNDKANHLAWLNQAQYGTVVHRTACHSEMPDFLSIRCWLAIPLQEADQTYLRANERRFGSLASPDKEGLFCLLLSGESRKIPLLASY